MSKFQHPIPTWAIASLIVNGILSITLITVLLRIFGSVSPLPVANASATTAIAPTSPIPSPSPQMGPRHQLNYQQWKALLAQEARAIAENQPENLDILLGDSISLWFPTHLLPPERTWLNQGISGETTEGLLNRLDLLDQTQPETIFLMIGINDVLRGIDDETILENQEAIIRYLQANHPNTLLVVQSILPHAAENSTWEGRDRLLEIPNQRIRRLNEELRAIATRENAEFLDLYPLFADGNGNLQPALSTDGLHLSEQGYLVWRTAIEMYRQTHSELTH